MNKNIASVKNWEKWDFKTCSEGQNDSFIQSGYWGQQWYNNRLCMWEGGTNPIFVRHCLNQNKIKADLNGSLIWLVQETIRIKYHVVK